MRLAIAATVGFTLITGAVVTRATRTVDRAILDEAQRFASAPLDLISSSLSAVGGIAVTSVVAVLLAAAFARRQGLLAATPLLMFPGVGIEFVLKRFVDHPAPPIALLRDAHWLAIGGFGEGGNAFPSGHLSRTAFLAFLVAARWPVLRWPAGGLIALMAMSRVYSASHWASDVVGGIFLGVALAGVAVAFENRRKDAFAPS